MAFVPRDRRAREELLPVDDIGNGHRGRAYHEYLDRGDRFRGFPGDACIATKDCGYLRYALHCEHWCALCAWPFRAARAGKRTGSRASGGWYAIFASNKLVRHSEHFTRFLQLVNWFSDPDVPQAIKFATGNMLRVACK